MLNVLILTLTLFMLDMLWFQVSLKTLYIPMFQSINGTAGYIHIPTAILSWVLIALLINTFAKSYRDAFLLGVLSYGIYNATNFATIKQWTVNTLIFDTLWGGTVCLGAYYVLHKIIKS
jgi:uncharacterized membrane protein